MKKFNLIFPLTIALMASSSFADEKKDESLNPNPQKITIENDPAADPIQTAPESAPSQVDKADQLITNRRLRADSGSLSKWSVSTAFTYQGGSLADPKEAQRPNIVQGAEALTLQNLTGDVGVRYRVTKLFSLTMSTGVFWTTPFHHSIKTNSAKVQRNFDENHQKMTVNDPTLKGTYVNKFWGIQSVTQAKLTLITNNQQKLDGYRWNYYVSEQVMYQFSQISNLSVGANFAVQFYSFSKENDALTDQILGIYPALEYVINEKLNFRTTLGQWVYQHIRSADTSTYQKRSVYQSLGFGILLSRDVFLYPNIQYIPSDIRSDRTNIALSTNINFF